MQPYEFHFDLPKELIANYPPAQRTGSRLLCLDKKSGAITHRHFPDLLDQLRPEDLMVFNNTRVIPARLFGRKATGGQIEVLLERLTGETTALAQVRASKAPGPGSSLVFDTPDGPVSAQVTGREGEFFGLQFALPVMAVADSIGHMPLPPYIQREDELADRERYQTVYAERKGAVAAPTAGLHFDRAMLAAIHDRGVQTAMVTLHVGAGTFQPVRTATVEAHKMHAEYLEVSAQVCSAVAACKARKGRVIAIGTTSVRCLETAAQGGEIRPYRGDTRIFIYPGYDFRVVDALVTNFHLPESTLIMLVSALAGRDNILQAYRTAVKERYRFFSYGDAMFIA